MSDYDPFSALGKKKDPAPQEEAEAGPDAPYDPFGKKDAAPTGANDAPDEPKKRVDPPPRDKEMEAPPGLAEGPAQAVSYRPIKFSGAILVGTGGLFLILAILGLVAFQTAINAEAVESRYNGNRNASSDIETARFWFSLTMFPAGALFLAAGAGIFYQQNWGRVMGAILLILHAVVNWFTIVIPILAIIAAVPLMKRKYAGWFR